ncbi:MAG: DUF2815 family protein [Bacillota bacterium]|nr:DUF2815 family protein [Bacillota bacterium]
MSTHVITGKVRLSYANLFTPRQNDDGTEGKYGVMLLIPKSDKTTLTNIKKAIEAAKEDGRTRLWSGKIPSNLKLPVRDGDEEHPEDTTYEGMYFMNVSAKTKPGVAKLAGKREDGTPILETVTDSTQVYSGCYAKVSINFFAYQNSGNKGISAGLNNVVKVADGEMLGGRARVEDEFAAVDFGDIDFEDEEELF